MRIKRARIGEGVATVENIREILYTFKDVYKVIYRYGPEVFYFPEAEHVEKKKLDGQIRELIRGDLERDYVIEPRIYRVERFETRSDPTITLLYMYLREKNDPKIISFPPLNIIDAITILLNTRELARIADKIEYKEAKITIHDTLLAARKIPETPLRRITDEIHVYSNVFEIYAPIGNKIKSLTMGAKKLDEGLEYWATFSILLKGEEILYHIPNIESEEYLESLRKIIMVIGAEKELEEFIKVTEWCSKIVARGVLLLEYIRKTH